MPLAYTPVTVDFGPDGNNYLQDYVEKQVMSLIQAHKELHDQKIVKWRQWYYGQPMEEKKSFPWENASNLVVQVIGTHVDSLKARILGTIFEVMPLYVLGLVGDWKAEDKGEEQREVLEDFLTLMGLEPKELDLYRVLSSTASDVTKFGTAIVKSPWETDIETQVISIDGGSSTVDEGDSTDREFTKYDGPRPEKLPFECFAITPQANTLESAEFKYHRRPLTRFQLEERKQRGIYNKADVDKIIQQGPDRFGPSYIVKQEEEQTGVKTASGFEHNAEWDVYECWFPFYWNKNKYRLIYTWHHKSKTCLKAVFNFYPDNAEPFESARLGYDGDKFHGYGFAEMLHHYQEEVSTSHNQDIDNQTLANTSVIRVDGGSKLDTQFSIYPMAILPFRQNEVEVFNLGREGQTTTDKQRMTLDLARERSGVDPGVSGTGGGITNPRKGVYSAMGTFSVIQAGNRRSNLNITDFRYFHLKLGRLLLDLYANFGIGNRARYFGERADVLKKALENVKSGRMNLPVRAATASINREMEKQNDMLLVNVMRQHYTGISQILQNLPQAPPHMQSYLVDIIKGSDSLMRHILRNFGHDDISRLLPIPQYIKELENGGQSAQPGAQNATAANGGSNIPAQGGNAPVVQAAGGAGIPQLPQ